MSERSDVTALLLRWNGGDEEAREALVDRVYDELLRIAASHLAGERSKLDLQPEALVHDAYLRLIDMDRIDWRNRAHFLAIAARVMRRILIDEARQRHAAKRDGGLQVTMTGRLAVADRLGTDVMMLHEALEQLAKVDPERAQLVELRFFGGLTNDEAAEVLGKSPRTLKRHWEVARGWLYRAMQSKDAGAPDQQ